jgi:quercetin dioxygenase-like cupin family protein
MKQQLRIIFVLAGEIFFQIGDEINNLKTNTLWEINNQKPHGVWNDSTQDRIHMIVDWIEEKDY